MSQNLTISDTGLKLIKAFEGYRPVDRELVSGQRIVGYGHRLYSEDAVIMNKAEAERVLRTDLEPFEEMINTKVHAPISQSQFDALCSFAYNIGPKAFLQSDTLRALNNGRPLDAANSLDIWRKSEIAGKTYVVDALMRRRTAEKALFLRADRYVAAGREDLPPVKDTTITGLSTEDALPVFTQEEANGIVATVPYAAKDTPMRRREDGPYGALQLSELDVIDDIGLEDTQLSDEALASEDVSVETVSEDETVKEDDAQENVSGLQLVDDVESSVEDELGDISDDIKGEAEARRSPIAAAASDIVARLDALIEDADTEYDDSDANWPESLIQAEQPAEEEKDATFNDKDAASEDNVIDLNTRESLSIEASDLDDVMDVDNIVEDDESVKSVAVIDELAQDDAFRMKTDSASKYIETYTPETDVQIADKASGAGLWIPVIVGFLLIGPAVALKMRGAEALLGAWGPVIVFTAIIIGAGLILAGIYAALRINSRN